MHDWAGNDENTRFMQFDPDTPEKTQAFLRGVIAMSDAEECTRFEYAVVLKQTGQLIGAACISLRENETASLGWILHRNHWMKGYGTEIGRTLLRFGFKCLTLRRIVAKCDAANYGSYRVMENIGMRREGLFVQSRRGNRVLGRAWHDEFSYAILREDWQGHTR